MNAKAGVRARVKICGVTNLDDARTAIALGADALGFNFFPGSKRFLALAENAPWIRELPPFVTKVAVLVNVPLSEACRVAEHPAIDMVQFHGDEDMEYCAEFARSGRPFIKATRLTDVSVIPSLADFSTAHVLLDAHVPGAFGGTGTAIDLILASETVRRHPALSVILAGGLTPANVGKAVSVVRPFAVDVASGVEVAPGRKDMNLVRAFIDAARGSF